MNTKTEVAQQGFRLSKLFWIGLGLFVVGVAPLLLIILFASLGFGDPNPNPVGPALLAVATFWPSIGLIMTGWRTSKRHRRKSENSTNAS
ncbi:MAG: hypothetical protein ACPGMQ_11985 [Pirellulales bacterium]